MAETMEFVDEISYNATDYTTGIVTPLYITIIFVIHAPLWILNVGGNSLVVLAVYREKNLRQPTYVLIAALAIADLFFPLFAYPPSIYAVVAENQYTCSLGTRKYFFLLTYACAGASFFHIMAITFERYIGVTNPLRYHDIVTMRRIVCLEPFIWAMSMLIGASAIMKGTEGDPLRPVCKRSSASSVFSFVTFILLSLGFLVIALVYLHIYRIARLHGQRIQAERNQTIAFANNKAKEALNKNNNNEDIQLKATKTIGIIIAFFVICWLPTTLRYFFEGIGASLYIDWTTWIIIKRTSETFWLINGAINPLVYARRSSQFRHAFKEIIKRTANRWTCKERLSSRKCSLSVSKVRSSLTSNTLV